MFMNYTLSCFGKRLFCSSLFVFGLVFFAATSFCIAKSILPQNATEEERMEYYLEWLEQSPDPSSRDTAASVLSKYKRPRVVSALIGCLSDPIDFVRSQCANSLWILGKYASVAKPALRKALRDPEERVRVQAAGALQAMGESPRSKELIEVRLAALESDSMHVRALAARGLARHVESRLLMPTIIELPAWEKGRASSNYSSASEILYILATARDRSIIPPLLQAINDGIEGEALFIRTVGRFSPPPDGWLDLLIRKINSESRIVRMTVITEMTKLTSNEQIAKWEGPVSAKLKDPDIDVRQMAKRAIQQAESAKAANALKAKVENYVQGIKNNSEGNAVSAEEMRKLNRQAAEQRNNVIVPKKKIDMAGQLQALHQQAMEQRRHGTAQSRKSLAKESYTTLYRVIRNDPDPQNRKLAMATLEILDLPPGQTLPIYINVMNLDKSEELRARAIINVGNMGAEAKHLVPLLKTKMSGGGKSEKTAAQEAIQKISSSMP